MFFLEGVQSQRWRVSDAAGSPLQLVGPAVSSLLPLLQVFPFGRCEPLSVHVRVSVHHNLLLLLLYLDLMLLLLLLHHVRFLLPVLPLALPHLLAELIHAVQGRVVDQRQEVPVPQPLHWTLLGRRGALLNGGGDGAAAGRLVAAVQQVVQALRVDDLQGDLEQGLDEAVLHRLAQVDPRVLLGQSANEEALLRANEAILRLDLEEVKKSGIGKETTGQTVWRTKSEPKLNQ